MNRKLLLLAGITLIAAASVFVGYLESSNTIRAASNESVAQDRLIQGFEEALVTVEESYAGSSDLELLGKAAIQDVLAHPELELCALQSGSATLDQLARAHDVEHVQVGGDPEPLLERSRLALVQPPPADWDGVPVAQIK